MGGGIILSLYSIIPTPAKKASRLIGQKSGDHQLGNDGDPRQVGIGGVITPTYSPEPEKDLESRF